jgi:D-alanyl-D-alanine carboxypeptidase (penicillin-binding protein 5/6)
MKLTRFFVAAVFLFLICPSSGGAEPLSDPFSQEAAAYWISIDGEPRWARHAARPLPPASLTKLMTALLVLEHGQLQQVLSISAAAANETGSRLGLQAGVKMRAAELLAAMVLKSANDACHALAEQVGASEQNFVVLMNRRALELGLQDTHFTNACGHDHPKHRSSARDLARLAEFVLQRPEFARLVTQVEITLTDSSKRHRYVIANGNELVGRYPGAIGVKTGFTRQAGKCVIALVERDKRRVLLVLLNAPERWWTATAMLDRALVKTSRSEPASLSPLGREQGERETGMPVEQVRPIAK